MTTQELRNRLLALFTPEVQKQIQPAIDAIIDAAKKEGEQTGRNQASSMIEMLVLGSNGVDEDNLRELMATLRG